MQIMGIQIIMPSRDKKEYVVTEALTTLVS